MYPKFGLPIINKDGCEIRGITTNRITTRSMIKKSKSIDEFESDCSSYRLIYVVRDNKIIDILVNTWFTGDAVCFVLAKENYPQKYNFDDWYNIDQLDLLKTQTILELMDDKFLLKCELHLKDEKIVYDIGIINAAPYEVNTIYQLLTSTNLIDYNGGYNCKKTLCSPITYLCMCMRDTIDEFVKKVYTIAPYAILEKFYDNLERNFPEHIGEIDQLRRNLILTKLTDMDLR